MIPGSPAPAIFRKQQQERELQQLTSDTQPSMPGSPKITLSRCKDDEVQKFNIPQFEDTMLEVRIISLNMDIEIKKLKMKNRIVILMQRLQYSSI